jgi:ABC-type multidrug transport system fused ATPase/permease subunit
MELTAANRAAADATERNGVRAESVSEPGRVPPALPDLLRRLWAHLSSGRRWQLGLSGAVMIASGLAEMVSLAAVVPFLTVLADPERLWSNPTIRAWATPWGATQPQDLLLPVMLLFAASAITSAGIRLFNLWLGGRLAAAIGSDLSQEAYRRTLYQPYSVHVARNSSTVITGVITHVNRLIYYLMYPCMQIVSNGIIILCMVGGLLLIDPVTAIGTIAVFGATYFVIGALTKSVLLHNSQQQAEHNTALVKNVQEGLGGIRDILLDRLQPFYVKEYRERDSSLRRLWSEAEFLSGFPRFLIEGMGLAGIACLAYWLVTRRGGLVTALPTLGTLALGAQRILPAVQQCYSSLAQVRTQANDLAAVVALLEQPCAGAEDHPEVVPAPFRESITLNEASFRYAPNQPWVFRDVDLTIRKGERVAIVGPTGSGKSTLVDVLMGLLPPTDGRLLIDGTTVSPEAWQSNIAHVPQAIFLADTSIAANIALGLPPDQIDDARLRSAAAQAQIAEFIESLPDGYRTAVGERGVRLSGGQRQRIGIARALYRQAPVLVLDEATSALDDATEEAVMHTLDKLSRELTIILIAHRLTTTEYCDRVIHVARQSVTVPE